MFFDSDINKIDIVGVVLAAGKGTRMGSEKPKVLHEINQKPMLIYVVDALKNAGIKRQILVVGGETEPFLDLCHEYKLDALLAEQIQRQGTADAVASAGVFIKEIARPSYNQARILKGNPIKADYMLICTGDTPAILPRTVQDFIHFCRQHKADMAVIGMRVAEPYGYGRIVCQQDEAFVVEKIVEQKDADEQEKKNNLCNSGIIFAKTHLLFSCLEQVSCQNASQEYYLTDTVQIARQYGARVLVYEAKPVEQFQGVNTPDQLEKVRRWMTCLEQH